MAFLSKKKEPKDEEVDVVERPKRARKMEKRVYEPKDPTRFLPILFLLIFLFISYLSWVLFDR